MSDVIIKKEDFIIYKTTPIEKDYKLDKEVGEGAFAKVFRATHNESRDKRAVKVISKNGRDIKELLEEVETLSKLAHPNIMQIYAVYDNDDKLYIVSEYCQGGELFDMISKKGSFCEKDAAFIMKQVLSAICYSHQNHIVHRDLKPENILLEERINDLTIKIIDWGCARALKENETLNQVDGSPFYIAPEVLAGKYDAKCDVWSCGVILYIILCGYPPFQGDSDDEIFKAVQEGELVFNPEDWGTVSEEAKDLIKKMLTRDPVARISALDCLAHPWFEKSLDKNSINVELSKKYLSNMAKFKENRKIEQATVGYIVNQLISKRERKELAKQFQLLDTNGDGVLSKEEIIQGYKKIFGAVDEESIDKMMKSVDLDGNGVIDYNEFISCALSKEKVVTDKNLKACFKAFDSDGSGNISAEELMSIFSKSAKESDKKVFEDMIKEVDKDGDGEISYEEFKKLMVNFFK